MSRFCQNNLENYTFIKMCSILLIIILTFFLFPLNKSNYQSNLKNKWLEKSNVIEFDGSASEWNNKPTFVCQLFSPNEAGCIPLFMRNPRSIQGEIERSISSPSRAPQSKNVNLPRFV
jgi:hypothetical protein